MGGGEEDWIGISAAERRPGLRLALLRGLPSPWSLAARAIFDVKGLAYQKVHPAPQDPPDALALWTGQRSYPAAVYDDERPRTGWAEILLLAERLAPHPRLIPPDPRQRAVVFGLSHELCGEMGLAWCRRLLGLEPRLREAADDPQVVAFHHRYGGSPAEVAGARGRVIEVLRLLARRLHRQREAGSEFLVGRAPSAADLHWAIFSNMVALLPQEDLPLDEPVRRGFTTRDPEILEALDPLLLEHRDAICRRFLRLPLEV